jgi:hypothetical protein
VSLIYIVRVDTIYAQHNLKKSLGKLHLTGRRNLREDGGGFSNKGSYNNSLVEDEQLSLEPTSRNC